MENILTDYEYYSIQYGDEYGRAILEITEYKIGCKYVWFGNKFGLFHRGDVLVFDKKGKLVDKIRFPSKILKFLPRIFIDLNEMVETLNVIVDERIGNLVSD